MIENLKDLERMLKLCRKQGVTEITTPEVSFKLGDTPTKYSGPSIEDEDEAFNPLDQPLTNEELTQWASGALGEN